jgi:hypothetical protein
VKFLLSKNRLSYSSLAVQLGAKAHSTPTPPTGPLLELLFEKSIEPPVVTLVSVILLTPAQPQPFGANYQWNWLVVGVEGDFDWLSVARTRSTVSTAPTSPNISAEPYPRAASA